MSNIRVINLRNYQLKENEALIKVDRSSILGNPYIMTSEHMRDAVCDHYQKHFDSMLLQDDHKVIKFKKELDRIANLSKSQNIALACWCYPKRCHAQIIQDYINLKMG
ncbi:MAG: DUF4326 domain-containing protein [Fastidiosipilaceae bacterium]|jgi:uncharacterized protein (DUF488 family)